MFCARKHGDDGGALAYSRLLHGLEKKFFSRKDAPREMLAYTLRAAIKDYEKKFGEKVCTCYPKVGDEI